jgi:phage terminase large subunit GpA-like protein
MAKCPHCEKQVNLESTKKERFDEVRKDVEGLVKKEVMYSCPHCDCVLGFAFFLGGIATGRP